MAPAAEQPANLSDSPMFSEVPSQHHHHMKVDEKALHLKDADLNIEANGKQHRTNEYSVMSQDQDRVNQQLVIRRGQEFSLELEFDNRGYVKGSDVVKLNFVLRLGQSKKKSYHDACFNSPSTVQVKVNDEETTNTTNGWLAHVASTNGKKITVNVKPSPKCAVGKWDLEVLLATQKNPASRRNVFSKPLYIIFNPWCPEDDTYYSEDPKHLDTYVLGLKGNVYTSYKGEGPSPRHLNWDYDQFDEYILDCALFLLGHKCRNEKLLSVPERGNVVKVIRRLASQVNCDSYDENGVLIGNWTGSYAGGQKPSYWTGSKEILQQYYKTKQPVKYGQCWVFAGVLTSVCRALGIPTRPITNYKSGHEIKRDRYTLSINKYYDANTGKRVDSKSDPEYKFDSIWNFHVWCEAWMKRGDIGEIYNGWQVVDATPQETSEEILNKGTDEERKVHIFTMGPAPVVACRRGDVNLDYDVDFLFGEVSSDVIYWYAVGKEKAVYKSIETKKWSVGMKLSTDDVENPGNRKDLTKFYKPLEGTEESRSVKANALVKAGVNLNRIVLNEKEPEILLYLPENEKGYRLPRKTYIGEPFKFEIIVENKNPHKKHAGKGWVQVYKAPSSYVTKELIEEFQLEFDVGPNSQKSFSYVVAYENYKKFLHDIDTILLVEYNASVTNEEIFFFDENYLTFGRLKLHIDMPSSVKEREKFTATVTMTNRTPLTLPDGVFTIREIGNRWKSIHKEMKLDSPIQPGETRTVTFPELKVKYAETNNKISLSVNFTSDSTKVSGYKNVGMRVYTDN